MISCDSDKYDQGEPIHTRKGHSTPRLSPDRTRDQTQLHRSDYSFGHIQMRCYVLFCYTRTYNVIRNAISIRVEA